MSRAKTTICQVQAKRQKQFLGAALSSASVLALAVASSVILSDPAAAQTWSGTTSTDWTVGTNWTGGVPTTGAVTINTTAPNPTVLGAAGAAAGTSGNLSVGTGGAGSLTIQNGSTLTTSGTGFSFIGANGSTGTMTVTGAGSAWILNGSPGAVSVIFGQTETASSGTLNISNGGAVSTAGDFAGGNVTLNVTGGGTLTTGRDAYLGRLASANATATISGAGSQWTIARRLLVGNGGTGALTVSNSAIVDVATSTTVGDSAGQGTLTIATGGVLQTPTLIRGTGPVQVNFDGGTLRAKANSATFISGFSGTQLNIAAGGLTVDTAGFNVATSSPFTGTGAFIKTGAGPLTLTGISSYTGNSSVRAGTLVLQNGGQITGTTAMTLSAVGATMTMTVSGTGSLLQTGSLTVAGIDAGANATLNVLNGGEVRASSTTAIGGLNPNTGTINVDGAGSLMDLRALNVGSSHSATNALLSVTNGGTVRSLSGSVGYFATTTGTKSVQISGSGSSWAMTGALTFSNGTISVLNGGAVSAASAVMTGATATHTASLLVSGAGSTYSLSGNLTTGSGAATITLADGGAMNVGGQLTLANTAFNIGGAEGQAATVAGTLNAATLVFGTTTGRVNFNQTDTAYVFATAMSGSGVVNQTGSGTTILTSDSTYTGGTTISAGTLQLGNGGTTGSITGNVIDNGTLTFNRSNSITFGGVISGSGNVIQTGAGTTILTGINTYAGGTILNAGVLQVAADSNLGDAAGGLTFNGGTFQNTAAFTSARTVTVSSGGGAFQTDADLTVSGVISGAGALTKTGTGTLILTAGNSYTGGTTISGGTLQLGDGGTSGSITGNVTNNAALIFNRSDALAFGGAISGTGAVSQIGSGTTTLSDSNSYAGGTTISAGTLAGSAISFGSGAILDNAALVVDQPTDAAFANAINGTGSFTKLGAGRLNYTGTGSLSGATTVSAGTLAVNGSLAASNVTVQSGASLGGNGTVGATTIQSGGNIAPGNSIGTLNVNGAFVQSAGSVYQVEVDPNTSASDLIAVNGTATIQSGAELSVTKYVPGDYRVGTVYTVLTSTGGRTGTYALSGQTSDVSAFLGLRNSYDANNAYLTVVQTVDPVQVAETPNQQQVAQNLPDPIVPPILNLPSVPEAQSAFDQLSAVALASAKGALVSNGLYVRDATLDRLRDVRCKTGDAARNAACDTEHPSLWAQGFGGWGGVSGNANASGLNRSTAGMLAGFDLPVAGWRLGMFGGFSNSDFHLTTGPASGQSSDYHLGAYGGTDWDGISLSLGASYSWNTIRTDRSIAFGTFTDRLQATYDAGVTQLFADAGYGMDMFGLTLEPFANLAYLNLRTGGFTEAGGAAALTARADTVENAITTFGVRPSTTVDLGDFPVTLRGMAGWRHTFGTVTPASTVAFAGGNAFTVSGAPIARDAMALEAGLDFALGDNISAGLTYGGQLSSRTTDQTARGTIRIAF